MWTLSLVPFIVFSLASALVRLHEKSVWIYYTKKKNEHEYFHKCCWARRENCCHDTHTKYTVTNILRRNESASDTHVVTLGGNAETLDSMYLKHWKFLHLSVSKDVTEIGMNAILFCYIFFSR